MSCGVGHRRGSDSVLLRLWCRPAVTAQIRPLAWEPPHATDLALKSQKERKKEGKKKGREGEREGGREKKKTQTKKKCGFQQAVTCPYTFLIEQACTDSRSPPPAEPPFPISSVVFINTLSEVKAGAVDRTTLHITQDSDTVFPSPPLS